MSTNAPTSRCIIHMYCHVDGVGLEVNIFFFQRNILIGSFLFLKYLFPTFFQFSLRFPSYFTLWIIFQFVFLLALCLLYTLNPLPICHPYIHLYIYIYIKGTIVEKPNLNFFRELFLSLDVLQSNLLDLNSLENSFKILSDLQPNFKKLSLSSPREVFTFFKQVSVFFF